MFDFSRARAQMVECQLRPNDVTNHRLLEAFLDVPREKFIASSDATLAYMDAGIRIGLNSDRYLTEPRVLGRMLQELNIQKSDEALVIGAGSGYSAAILSHLAESVIAIESDPEHAARATEVLESLDITNVVVVEGDLANGYPEQAPFDVIIVDGATAVFPKTLCEQLLPSGRIAAIVGTPPYGRVCVATNDGPNVSERPLFNASAHLLPGFELVPEFQF